MIITVANVKAYLDITSSTYDTVIEIWIRATQKFIEQLLNMSIEQATYYEIYDGTGERTLMLDNYPIISVAKLSDDIDISTKKYNSFIAAADILIQSSMGMIEYNDNIFSENERNIYIEYAAGYASGAIPYDIQLLAYEMIAKKYHDKKDARYGVQSKNLFNENISYSIVDVTPQHREIINSYHKPARRKAITTTVFSAA